MPPAQELTAPSPRVPALAVPRVAVRYRVALAVLALTALTFLAPVGADVRPVGVDHLGPRDPAPRPLDRRRPVVEAAAGAADHAVRALRRPRPRPVAVRRPRRRASPASSWPSASRGGSAACPAGAAAAGAYAVAPWMLRNAALGNSEGLLVGAGAGGGRPPPRRAAPATPSCSGIGAALLRPEAWPFLGLYGLWLFWRDPGRAPARRGGLRLAAACCGCCPSCGARATCCAPRTARSNPRANSAAFADDPVREVLRQFADDAHARAVDRARRARGVLALRLRLGPPRARARPSAWRWPARSGSPRSR